jgi:hypothetical protein
VAECETISMLKFAYVQYPGYATPTSKRRQLAEDLNIELIKTRTTYDYFVTEQFLRYEEERLGVKFDGVIVLPGTTYKIFDKFLIGTFVKSNIGGKSKLRLNIHDLRKPSITEV